MVKRPIPPSPSTGVSAFETKDRENIEKISWWLKDTDSAPLPRPSLRLRLLSGWNTLAFPPHVRHAFWWVTIALFFGLLIPMLVRTWPSIRHASSIEWGTLVHGGELLYLSNALIGAALGDYFLSKARHVTPLGVVRGLLIPFAVLVASILELSSSIPGEPAPSFISYLDIAILVVSVLFAFFTKSHISRIDSCK
jgi:hypothetical protein